MFHSLPSRRRFLQAMLAAASPALAGLASAKAEADLPHVVSPWTGLLSALNLVDTTGKTWRPADLQGRAVLLNFWASWCEPCRAEMPTLAQVAELYGPDKLLVLAINFKQHPSRALQFAKNSGFTLPVLLDVDGRVAQQWGVKVFPTTLTVNRHGQPQQRVQGQLDWTGSAAEKLITRLF